MLNSIKKRIGILSLQGNFNIHCQKVLSADLEAVYVKNKKDFEKIDALILPGGESSTQINLIIKNKLYDVLQLFMNSNKKVFATCAGLILLSKNIIPNQKSLETLDITVERNGWGAQIDSFESYSDINNYHMIFIRAPRIKKIGNNIDILDTYKGEPVFIRSNNIYASTFHPELTDQNYYINYLLGNS